MNTATNTPGYNCALSICDTCGSSEDDYEDGDE